MIVMPPVIDHVGIEEDREEVEEDFVEKKVSTAGEWGVMRALIGPVLEKRPVWRIGVFDRARSDLSIVPLARRNLAMR